MVAAHDFLDRPSRLFTRDEYHAMAEAGILKDGDRVELINGRIIPMLPHGPWHISSCSRLTEALMFAYQQRMIVSSSASITLDELSEPEPDIVVLKRRKDFYAKAPPISKDVVLLIEISDTTRAFDLGTKQDLYAQHAIPEYWVVDQKQKCVQVFRDPFNGIYREKQVYSGTDVVPLPGMPRKSIKVTDAGV